MEIKLAPFIATVLMLVSCSRPNRIILISNKTGKLNIGSIAHHEGLTIGQVTKIEDYNRKKLIELTLLDNQIKVPKTSTFTIIPSPLGTVSISVTYSNNTNLSNSNDTLVANYKEIESIEDYISDTTKLKKVNKSLEKIAEGLSGIVEATKDTLHKR